MITLAKELNKEQKKKVMQYVLNQILIYQKNKDYSAYICNLLAEAIKQLGYSQVWITHKDRLKLFPELLKYKPKHISDKTCAWWNDDNFTFDYNSRIKVVEALIKEYSE